jgi:hypothetical protein
VVHGARRDQQPRRGDHRADRGSERQHAPQRGGDEPDRVASGEVAHDPDPGDHAESDGEDREQPPLPVGEDDHGARRDRGKADVAIRGLTIEGVHRADRRDGRLAHVQERGRGHPVGGVAGGVIRVAVADRREVQAGDAGRLEDGEVGVVGQALVDLERVRRAMWTGRGIRPGADQRFVAGAGLEQDRRSGRSGRLEVDVTLQPGPQLGVAHRTDRAHQTELLAVGEEHHQRVAQGGRGGEQTRGLERHGGADAVVHGARGDRDRVVVGDQRERVVARAGARRHDVGDPHRAPVLRARGIDRLRADVEAIEA